VAEVSFAATFSLRLFF